MTTARNQLLKYVNRFGLSAATVSYFKFWGNLLPTFCLRVLMFRAPSGSKQMKRYSRCIIKIDRTREHLQNICYLRQRLLIVLNYWWCFICSKEWDVLSGMFHSVFAAWSKFVLWARLKQEWRRSTTMLLEPRTHSRQLILQMKTRHFPRQRQRKQTVWTNSALCSSVSQLKIRRPVRFGDAQVFECWSN